MIQLLAVIVILAIVIGTYSCSPEEKSELQQKLETPQRVEQDVQKKLEQGMLRNRRELERNQ